MTELSLTNLASTTLTKHVLEVAGLNRRPSHFDLKRYVHLKHVVQKLSRDKRSVPIIDSLLSTIFFTEDAQSLHTDPHTQIKCIHMKFVICQDLAKSCKLKIQQLFRYCSEKIYGLLTHLLILNGAVVYLIEEFLGLGFYTDVVLHRSWYYLLKEEILTYDVLERSVLGLKNPHSKQPLYELGMLKRNLCGLFAKIALAKKLTHAQRKQMLQKVKLSFAFDSDQELVELYNSRVTSKNAFESLILLKMMETLGISRHYFLEKELVDAEADKTLRQYDGEQLLASDFFGKMTPNEHEKMQRMSSGLEFLNSYIKKEATLSSSDFAVCFLDAFHFAFPALKPNTKSTSLDRQSTLWSFIRTVELLLQKKIFSEEQFRQALIMKSIFVLRQAIQEKETSEMGIFAMSNILNAIGLRQVTAFLNYFFALVVHAFDKFPDSKKIKKYTAKIFEFYIKEKKNFTMSKFKEIQFVLLKSLQKEKRISDVVAGISAELYGTRDDIAANLKEHVRSLKKANEDIRILSVKYILELLESKTQNEIRIVLVSKDVLKVVYRNILEMKQQYKTDRNQRLAILCAKCIAAIGLCHSFVNDPVLLKATNQQTLVSEGTEQDIDDKNGAPNVIKSDHYNPVTQMKYKETKRDNTLELLAVPNFKLMQLERTEYVTFAKCLAERVHALSLETEERPKNFYFTSFLLSRFISTQDEDFNKREGTRGDQLTRGPGEASLDVSTENIKLKNELLAKSIMRFDGWDLSQYKTKPLASYNQRIKGGTLNNLVLYLIALIEDKRWQQLMEACVPLLKKSQDFLYDLLPYVVYYSLRFGPAGNELSSQLSQFFNQVLDSDMASDIQKILECFDFLSIAREQDKHLFKEYIESETRFKYVEKLFFLELDINNKDQNIVSFVKIVNQSSKIKASFLVVKKINELFLKLDRSKKTKGANSIKSYKRCVFNAEDFFRASVNQPSNTGKGFLDILPPEDTVEVVKLHKHLNPEDFDSPLFNNIIEGNKKTHFQGVTSSFQNMNIDQPMVQMHTKTARDELQLRIDQLFSHDKITDEWKSSNWQVLIDWLGDFDLNELKNRLDFKEHLSLMNGEAENPLHQFELVLALIFAEYAKGLKNFLKSDELKDTELAFRQYLSSLCKIKNLIDMLYHEFIMHLEVRQGEITYYYKLFLHVLYEVESAVVFLKDVFMAERDKVSEMLKREVNRDRRKFEKIYYEFSMSTYFEHLLGWFEERSQQIQSSTESLLLVQHVRRVFFSIFDRENEYAYYLMRLTKIYRKTSNDVLLIQRLFKECEKLSHKIVDYELEFTKYTLQTKNAHEAFQYLQSKIGTIEEKQDQLQKQSTKNWMPRLIYQKAQLLAIELQIKIEPRNPTILENFSSFVKNIQGEKWEKPHFRFAQYLDMLDSPPTGITVAPLPADMQKRRTIQKIFYYIKSLQVGHKFIWQSLPRALELWFSYQYESDDQRMQTFMRQELIKLEDFKVAQALQLLLSRFGHQNEAVRDTILCVLSKLAVAYPAQCAWWIFHFHFFEDGNLPQKSTARAQFNASKQAISRAEFAKELIKKILARDKDAGDLIMKSEQIFGDLKKLSERPIAKQNENQMDIPRSLAQVEQSNLVMPIEENLSPQLPPLNYKKEFSLRSLVSTQANITKLHEENAKISDAGQQEEEKDDQSEGSQAGSNKKEFPAFKACPVMIQGFLQKVTIMVSKERPKKIGILGSDRRVYNFLLKCDKYGDLRKEQRFIDFAVLCNKMLDNDSETRKRNLKLRTYAIVPLSRNTGLIEWIQNTTTIKCIVGDYWKKQNMRGEMVDIKKKAQEMNAGDTHTQIWSHVKETVRPVLGGWFADHFPSPELWYEARINFIKSTAIWSMLGYIIGLGDRHGDNILIHQHTGEVTHVDFDCIFEKGAKLKIPEIVPFRLTQNIMDAFGIFKEKGVFQRTSEVVLKVLRKNQSNIVSFLTSFKNDPLIESTNNIKVEITDALEVVKKKLNGQIGIEGTGALSIEEQVEQIILNAINDASLSKMYIGWMPWL